MNVSYFIMFVIVYIISFFCMFEKNVELIGYGLLYTINIFASIFFINDVQLKLGNNDIAFPILAVVFILNVISSSLFIVSISRIYTYSKGKGEIILSRNNKKKIHVYRDLFISVIVFIILVMLYLLMNNEPRFKIDNVFGQNISIYERMIEILKFGVILYLFGMSSYLVYHSKNLETITRSLV